MMTTHYPLIAMTPDTCTMIARYHDRANNPEDANKWRRIALVLFTARQYTDGHLNDDDMQHLFSAAIHGRNEAVKEVIDKHIPT